ncbi:MAG: cysteine desulfurase family protein [Bacilli bacterium]|nr:cysteine desulfurase family protein [Bacilli bacterium]
MNKVIFLDNASTTKIDARILDSYSELLKKYFANAASTHSLSNEVKELQEQARAQIARYFKRDKNDVIFTSGATESNNLALKGVAMSYARSGKHIITTTIEHSSVKETCEQLRSLFGYEITYLEPDENGVISLEAVKSALRPETILVSIMGVNNEIGSINDIYTISKYIKEHSKALVHVDAAQALFKVQQDYSYCDLITVSAHKIYGLKGSGALIKNKGVKLTPILSGGGHEFGYRSGTSNYATNIMLAKSIRLNAEEYETNHKHVQELHDYLYDYLAKQDKIQINSPKDGSPYIVNFSIKGRPGATIAQALDQQGIMVSVASACSSNKSKPTNVVYKVFHDEDLASGAIRVSFAKYTTLDEVKTFCTVLMSIIQELRG